MKTRTNISPARPIDLTEKLKPYNNKWVALSFDHKELIAAADTLKATKEKAEKQNKQYLLLKLPPFNIHYVPYF